MNGKKKIIVCGYDGYIGTPLVLRLLKRGHSVMGIDNELRRECVQGKLESDSATKIMSREQKDRFLKTYGTFSSYSTDIAINADELDEIIKVHKPDVVLNLAHVPSGPYSMISRDTASYSLMNNIVGTNNLLWSIKKHCPDCHYITIGTTGEYSHYSNIAIEEGYFKINWEGRMSEKMIYPRRPTSIYHTSKVGCTYLIDYLCRIWGLKATDVMQAVVFGLYTPECKETGVWTRFDSDEAFGTVVNRFIIQALLGKPLTVYGDGLHQRGFISLNDSIQALEIAIENEPKRGDARVWNQLSSWDSINSIAEKVRAVSKEIGLPDPGVQRVETPRHEHTGEHFYEYKTDILKGLGYSPTRSLKDETLYCMKALKGSDLRSLEGNVIPKILF